MSLKGKTAIVSGATQGIGKGIALVLAREGANVVVAGRNHQRAEQTVTEIRNAGGEALKAIVNILDQQAVEKMVSEVIEHYGKVDILVNNAVAPSRNAPFAETTPEDWDADFGVGLRGYLICTRAVVNHMVKQGSGRIISISSSAGKVGSPNLATYSAAKGAIIAFTKALARELATTGVTVNTVAPGATNTPMQDRLTGEFKRYMVSTIPMKRYAEPEEIGEAVAFLASDRAGYITGQTISVDGGRTMQ